MQGIVRILFGTAAAMMLATMPVSGQEEIYEKLEGTVITARMSASAATKIAARTFSDRYLRNYAAPVTAVRTISSNGRCREVQAVTGIFASRGLIQDIPELYWNDPGAKGTLGFTDAFISMPLEPDRNTVNPILSMHPSGKDLKQFDTGYIDRLDLSVLDKVRTLELFSPLNARRVNDFNLTFEGYGRVGEVPVRLIGFRTRKSVSWKKSRLHCSGVLHIDGNGIVRRIETTDMDDRFSFFIRTNTKASRMATPYRIVVDFAVLNGYIYMSRVSQELVWKKPEHASSFIFNAEWNTYKMPFKHNYSSSTVIDFETPAIPGPDDFRAALQLTGTQPAQYLNTALCDRPDTDFWKRTLEAYTDFGKVLSDMGVTWDGLCGLAEERQKAEMEEQHGDAGKYKSARAMFKQIFGREYNM